MIKISYEEVAAKIKEKAGIDEKEFAERVEKKLKDLSGLISRDGAAHIVANEVGVKLFEQVTGRLQIKNILAGMRDVETVGKVMQVYEIKEFVSGERASKVGSMIIGDETSSIRVVLWGNQADNLQKVSVGNVVKIVGAYVRENRGKKEVQLNERAQLVINPVGEDVNVAASSSVSRKNIKDIKDVDDIVEVLGNVVQVFEPRFFEVCPQCGKRAKMSENSYVCASHQVITPVYSYVMNAIVDDGTDTIRCVFFRQNADNLLKVSAGQMLQFKDNPEVFGEVKSNLQGTIVKLRGRVNKNQMFDRNELVIEDVDSNPNPEDEIKRIGQ